MRRSAPEHEGSKARCKGHFQLYTAYLGMLGALLRQAWLCLQVLSAAEGQPGCSLRCGMAASCAAGESAGGQPAPLSAYGRLLMYFAW